MEITKDEKHANRYVDYAVVILSDYHGKEPFHLYLKNYFRKNRKHGSKDRKKIRSLCYTYFRLYHGFTKEISIVQRLIFCNDFIKQKTEIEENEQFDIKNIFPYYQHLSSGISAIDYRESLLQQPDFFLRIRPGHLHSVIKKLDKNNITYDLSDGYCLRLPNGAGNISDILSVNKEVVVQDLNSQATAFFFDKITTNKMPINVWDACAGSGGKSILLNDHFRNIRLTATDNRNVILKSLKIRLGEAGITVSNCFKADLTRRANSIEDASFDLILTDVPCTGSGTWSRIPERVVYFDEMEIGNSTSLQKKIVRNCLPKLKEGGYLLYLTCSVFKEENEENIAYFTTNHPLKLVAQKYFNGMSKKADTLFGALMKKL